MRKGLDNLKGPVGQRTARGFGWRRLEGGVARQEGKKAGYLSWQQIQAPVGLVLSCVGAKARRPMTRPGTRGGKKMSDGRPVEMLRMLRMRCKCWQPDGVALLHAVSRSVNWPGEAGRSGWGDWG